MLHCDFSFIWQFLFGILDAGVVALQEKLEENKNLKDM